MNKSTMDPRQPESQIPGKPKKSTHVVEKKLRISYKTELEKSERRNAKIIYDLQQIIADLIKQIKVDKFEQERQKKEDIAKAKQEDLDNRINISLNDAANGMNLNAAWYIVQRCNKYALEEGFMTVERNDKIQSIFTTACNSQGIQTQQMNITYNTIYNINNVSNLNTGSATINNNYSSDKE